MAKCINHKCALLRRQPRTWKVLSDYLRTSNYSGFSDTDPGIKIKTRFGFEKLDPADVKQDKVNSVFQNVASNYDKMNDLMSFGMHRLWKDKFMETLNPSIETKLLDLAGGTGDIAFRYLKYIDYALKNRAAQTDNNREKDVGSVTVCDINPSMLEVGKERAAALSYGERMSWVVGNAEQLPFDSDSYSACTIAFGIRNVTDIRKVLAEVYRVLQPGGRFLCLEFSHVKNENIRKIYDVYSMDAIPVMGYLVAGQWDAYQYLVESIRNFPEQDAFKSMIQEAGFRAVTYTNLTWGVVAIHSGFKL